MFLLILVTPIVFNFDEYLSIGDLRTDKNYRSDFSIGYGELNMDMHVLLIGIDRYSYAVSAHLSSGSDVEIVGITYFNYTITAEGSPLSSQINNWDPPRQQFTFGSTVQLTKNEIIIWSGSAEVSFISDSTVQNETFYFNFGITIPMDSEDYYKMDLVEYVVFFAWIMAFPLIPLILKFVIQPQFGVPLDDETKKKRKSYFDFFKKAHEEQN